jgi:hypothetical protein
LSRLSNASSCGRRSIYISIRQGLDALAQITRGYRGQFVVAGDTPKAMRYQFGQGHLHFGQRRSKGALARLLAGDFRAGGIPPRQNSKARSGTRRRGGIRAREDYALCPDAVQVRGGIARALWGVRRHGRCFFPIEGHVVGLKNYDVGRHVRGRSVRDEHISEPCPQPTRKQGREQYQPRGARRDACQLRLSACPVESAAVAQAAQSLAEPRAVSPMRFLLLHFCGRGATQD